MNPPWIYVAGPLFTQAEIHFNAAIAHQLRQEGYRIYLPQDACAGITEPHALFDTCMVGLEGAAMVIVILDGPDADSGSCFEVGYAYAKQLPIVGMRTDFRGSGEHMGVNLMLTHSCHHILLTSTQPPEVSPSRPTTYLKVGESPAPRLLSILETMPPAQRCRH